MQGLKDKDSDVLQVIDIDRDTGVCPFSGAISFDTDGAPHLIQKLVKMK